MSLEMGQVGSKTRSLDQIIEPMLLTKGLQFKSLHYNAIPHNTDGSGENLQGHMALLSYICFQTLICKLQQILLERPCLVYDQFYLATSITCPNQNEAEDIGHLKYLL